MLEADDARFSQRLEVEGDVDSLGEHVQPVPAKSGEAGSACGERKDQTQGRSPANRGRRRRVAGEG